MLKKSLRKPKKILQSGCIRVYLLSYESQPIDKWEQYDWMTVKNLDGKLLGKTGRDFLHLYLLGKFEACREWGRDWIEWFVKWMKRPQKQRQNTRPNFFQASSRIALLYQSVRSCMISDWINLTVLKKKSGQERQKRPHKNLKGFNAEISVTCRSFPLIDQHDKQFMNANQMGNWE